MLTLQASPVVDLNAEVARMMAGNLKDALALKKIAKLARANKPVLRR
ncbi:MAG: hypothetical protein IPG50_04455 [Myxococcales bacterium]|nr:hypothetical protein [Myxococcales bacterium]